MTVLSISDRLAVSFPLRSTAGARGRGPPGRESMTTRDDARRGAANVRPDEVRLGAGRESAAASIVGSSAVSIRTIETRIGDLPPRRG
jgi:hypothetical protein